jgi:uncharacterized protein (DUF488 family)
VAPTVLTIGHSTRAISELLALLGEFGVTTLVDVRRFPASRRHPHFNGPALASALGEIGIAYGHEPDMGGRREALPGSRNTAWRVAAFRGYADHMANAAFRSALDRLRGLAARATSGPPAILCAEAVPWHCHRQLIADALVAGGTRVRHILGPGRAEDHAVNPSAVRGADGVVVYPASPPAQKALFPE